MKKIYLFRHSTPDKTSILLNEYIPLSQGGDILMKQLVNKLHISLPLKVYSSPYIRAKQTAETVTSDVITDTRLIERKTGNKDTFTKELWLKQYNDPDAKNDNGESFRAVQKRMDECMREILAKMDDSESVIVISHAAAICAYLQQYCTIKVTDVNTKHRSIAFNNETVLEGIIKTPSCFALTFDKDLISVSYIE